MTPAVKIYRNARGEWLPHDVDMHYGRPARLEDALERVRQGGTVFVQVEDASRVLEVAKGAGDSTVSEIKSGKRYKHVVRPED